MRSLQGVIKRFLKGIKGFEDFSFLSFISSSWCRGLAAVYDCGTSSTLYLTEQHVRLY